MFKSKDPTAEPEEIKAECMRVEKIALDTPENTFPARPPNIRRGYWQERIFS